MFDSIKEFYNGKSILVTGATGFVGKLLIEKLLYSCDKLERIYCLIRDKNGHSGEERLNEITSCKVVFHALFFCNYSNVLEWEITYSFCCCCCCCC